MCEYKNKEIKNVIKFLIDFLQFFWFGNYSDCEIIFCEDLILSC